VKWSTLWKEGYKILTDDKQIQQMFKDFAVMEKELKQAVKQTDALKERWKDA